MIGRFTTRQYESRAAFEERRPSGVHVVYNRYTSVGIRWMWDMMAGHLRNPEGGLTDHLGSARLVVGNSSQGFSAADTRLAGDQTAQAALDHGFPTLQGPLDLEDGRMAFQMTFQATFGEDEAVFDWQERGVVSAQGVLIDRAVGDHGRKVLGSVWQCIAELQLAG